MRTAWGDTSHTCFLQLSSAVSVRMPVLFTDQRHCSTLCGTVTVLFAPKWLPQFGSSFATPEWDLTVVTASVAR